MLTKIIGGVAGLALGVGAFTFCNFAGGICPLGGSMPGGSTDGVTNVRPVAAMTADAGGDTCCPHGDKKEGESHYKPVINASADLVANTEIKADPAHAASGETCSMDKAKMAKGDCETTADCQPGVDCPLEKAPTVMGTPIAAANFEVMTAEGKTCDSAKKDDCEPGKACPVEAAAKVAEKSEDTCTMPCHDDEKAQPAANLTTASAVTD